MVQEYRPALRLSQPEARDVAEISTDRLGGDSKWPGPHGPGHSTLMREDHFGLPAAPFSFEPADSFTE